MTPMPDDAEAQAFLDALDRDGHFIFQTFDDTDAKRGDLARILVGTFDQHREQLHRLNRQGAGVFVMVNAGTERNNKSVTRVRKHFVDLDGAPLQPVLECASPPQIVVQTSPNRYHAYWDESDCPLEHFKPRQQLLAKHFGGDPSVCDLARVMRLPGYCHMKTPTPYQVKRLITPGAKIHHD